MKKWKVVKMEYYFSPQVVKSGFKTKREAEEFLEQYRKENNYNRILAVDFEYSPECFGSELQYGADSCEGCCDFCKECWKQILKNRYPSTDAERQ